MSRLARARANRARPDLAGLAFVLGILLGTILCCAGVWSDVRPVYDLGLNVLLGTPFVILPWMLAAAWYGSAYSRRR